eukprot:CAMPEP_0194525898 /NCGR_PEP_ID=MMETSP0253-20130528/61555_1 /TAXON_ID=2966 /ORGANISM="Noctiluca scintillans" /LENGTH=31 /DNA_ID= /DNA_START= /DNA_END= /DNA_ORIENTATION=
MSIENPCNIVQTDQKETRGNTGGLRWTQASR